jgi:hypothetical protein
MYAEQQKMKSEGQGCETKKVERGRGRVERGVISESENHSAYLLSLSEYGTYTIHMQYCLHVYICYCLALKGLSYTKKRCAYCFPVIV